MHWAGGYADARKGPWSSSPAECHPRLGETDCLVSAPRAFNFATGRKDCLVTDTAYPYKTHKEESAPDAGANGPVTMEWFKSNFGFNGRETVAIMGAHTLGSLDPEVSSFEYTWKTRSQNLFNNGYYRNLAEREERPGRLHACRPHACRPHACPQAACPQPSSTGLVLSVRLEQLAKWHLVAHHVPRRRQLEQDAPRRSLEAQPLRKVACEECQQGCVRRRCTSRGASLGARSVDPREARAPCHAHIPSLLRRDTDTPCRPTITGRTATASRQGHRLF